MGSANEILVVDLTNIHRLNITMNTRCLQPPSSTHFGERRRENRSIVVKHSECAETPAASLNILTSPFSQGQLRHKSSITTAVCEVMSRWSSDDLKSGLQLLLHDWRHYLLTFFDGSSSQG